jgi:catechol 2,3-dioxygenase-like lactoylglutathione lyase family enzyme
MAASIACVGDAACDRSDSRAAMHNDPGGDHRCTDDFSATPALHRATVPATRRRRPRRKIVDWKLELVMVPVSDVDRAKAFYVDQLGFRLDVDHRAGEHFRVVQMTPPGSACSISIGVGMETAEPGSVKGLHLVVEDIESAQRELIDRSVDVSQIFHFGEGGQVVGPDPERRDYGSFLSFSDPDGNSWAVQEVPSRAVRG